MIRFFKHFARAGLIVALLFGLPVQAIQVRDDRGLDQFFAQAPQRIVSLLPSLTETVCVLGACKRLVGTDRYSDYPQEVKSLVKVGGGLDPNIESIVALRPEVVLMASSPRLVERLGSLGIRVLVLEPKTHADVRRVLETLGTLLQVPDAQGIWRGIDADLTNAAHSLTGQRQKRRVYFEVNRGLYAASESSFLGETLTRLGVSNIVPAGLGAFPKLNPEFVVRADPDLIMAGKADYPEFIARPGWRGMQAIRKDQVCVFSQQQLDVLLRPGPRLAEGARLMATCIQDKAP
jgi:iron complex transport system substrate-binding protein